MGERRPDVVGNGGAFDAGDETLDDVFESLAHPRRRRLLSAVAADAPRTLDGLATTLAADASDGERDVYLSLRHVHVPKLVDCDVLAYDGEETVAPGERATLALAALEEAAATLDATDATGGDASGELFD